MSFIIVSIILIIICILLFAPFYINIIFERKNNDNNFELKILLFKGLVKFGVEIPFVDIIMAGDKLSVKYKNKIEEGDIENDISEDKHIVSFKKILNKVERVIELKQYITPIINYITRKVKITKIYWSSQIGIENAAVTAILTGSLWSLKSFLFEIIYSNVKVRKLKLNVIPKYNCTNLFETYFNCIIRLKLVYIIIAGYNGLKVKKKVVK